MQPSKILVSDLGKVLLPFDIGRVWSALAPHFPTDVATGWAGLREVYLACRLGVGGADGPDFHAAVVERTGLRLSYREFALAWSDMFWEDPPVLDLMVQAPFRQRVLLSNTNCIHWEFISQRYPHVLAPFDLLLTSHELGLEKPAPEIYLEVLRLTGAASADHLFVDDIPENVAGAVRLGIDGIVHTGAQSLHGEFARRGLADPNRAPSAGGNVSPTPADLAFWAEPTTQQATS